MTPVLEPNAALDRAGAREKGTRRARRPDAAARRGSSAFTTAASVRALVREDPRLRGARSPRSRVAVEVVRRDVGQDGHVRRERRRRRAGRRRARRRSRAAIAPRGTRERHADVAGERDGPPARRRMSAIQAVVVDLPFVPVTATQRFSPLDLALGDPPGDSNSASTGARGARAATTGASSAARPARARASRRRRGERSGAAIAEEERAPRGRAAPPASANALAGVASPTETATPRSSSARRARGRSARSRGSPTVRGQDVRRSPVGRDAHRSFRVESASDGEEDRQDPEPDDDPRLGPARGARSGGGAAPCGRCAGPWT